MFLYSSVGGQYISGEYDDNSRTQTPCRTVSVFEGQRVAIKVWLRGFEWRHDQSVLQSRQDLDNMMQLKAKCIRDEVKIRSVKVADKESRKRDRFWQHNSVNKGCSVTT